MSVKKLKRDKKQKKQGVPLFLKSTLMEAFNSPQST